MSAVSVRGFCNVDGCISSAQGNAVSYCKGFSCSGGVSKIISPTSGCECFGKAPSCDGTDGLDSGSFEFVVLAERLPNKALQ